MFYECFKTCPSLCPFLSSFSKPLLKELLVNRQFLIQSLCKYKHQFSKPAEENRECPGYKSKQRIDPFPLCFGKYDVFKTAMQIKFFLSHRMCIL